MRPGRRTELAEDLIRERKRRGLSQAQAAAQIPCSRSEWALWESRKLPALPVYVRVVELWLRGAWPITEE